MDCGKVMALLSPYLDGELGPSEKDFVFAHLNACPACRRELAELQAAVCVFRQLPELAPGPAFLPRLKERLARESRSLPAGGGDPGLSSASPQGGRALPDALPRLSGAAAPAGRRGESREVPRREAPRRAGLQAVFGLFRSGAGLWPKLAVAAVLLLAMGITSLWSGLAGPGLLPKLPVSRLAGQPPQLKGEDAWNGRAESAGSPERKASTGDLSAGRPPEGEAGRYDLFALAPQGVPAPDQATGAGAYAAKKSPAETGHDLTAQRKINAAAGPETGAQKESAGRQKIFLTASPEPSESAPEPAAAAAAAREKENPAVPGAAPGEEKPAAFSVGQEKEKDSAGAGAGAIAAGKAAEQAAPAKKLARRMKIELAGADARKLSGLLAQFARPEEKPAAAGSAGAGSAGPDSTAAAQVAAPAAADPGPELNSLAVRVEAAQMTELLTQLKLLGKVLQQEETSRDLTADYARLKTELGQKQLQADDLQRVIVALNKNSRSTRDAENASLLAEELKKIQTEIQAIQEELRRKDEELKTVAVEIYWRK